jgi:hypothetical protein
VPFTDVDPYNPFYSYIRCLYCRGIIGGYGTNPPCDTGTPCFRPFDNISRSQAAKLVSNAAGYTDPIPSTRQTFTDVPPSNAAWVYIERVYLHGAISGYNTSPPCTTGLPCFLPDANLTRGQLAKIVSNAAGYTDPVPSTAQTFTDVPYGHTFWVFVQRLAERGIISGYACGGPGDPCDPQQRPYYHPDNVVTRGQASKIVANSFFPLNCMPSLATTRP